MKNIILISSTLCAIAMIWFINISTKSMNQSKEKEMEPVKEWLEDIKQQQKETPIGTEVRQEPIRAPFSLRMKSLSIELHGISTELVNCFKTASNENPGKDLLGTAPSNTDPNGAALLNSLIQRQKAIIDDFKQLQFDLGQQLKATPNDGHKAVLIAIRESNAVRQLEDIRYKLLKNHAFPAAENSNAWAEKMAEWATQLENSQ